MSDSREPPNGAPRRPPVNDPGAATMAVGDDEISALTGAPGPTPAPAPMFAPDAATMAAEDEEAAALLSAPPGGPAAALRETVGAPTPGLRRPDGPFPAPANDPGAATMASEDG